MMSSEKSDNAVPSVSPGSSPSSAPGTVKATPDLMSVSPLLEDTERQMSAGSVSVKDALRRREWLKSRLHQLRVQLQMKKSGISVFFFGHFTSLYIYIPILQRNVPMMQCNVPLMQCHK